MAEKFQGVFILDIHCQNSHTELRLRCYSGPRFRRQHKIHATTRVQLKVILNRLFKCSRKNTKQLRIVKNRMANLILGETSFTVRFQIQRTEKQKIHFPNANMNKEKV